VSEAIYKFVRGSGYKVCILLLCLVASGCSSLVPRANLSWWSDADETVVPDRVMPIWADTVLHQPGKPGVRGFGGRLYFYQDQESDPVKVAGNVSVYVFDGENLQAGSSAPLKKYLVTASQLESHYSKTGLGHSYSIWVPWGQVGGPSRTLSLIVRFDGVDGGTVLGEASTELLPGTVSQGDQPGTIQRVAFEKSVDKPSGRTGMAGGVTAHTIELPPSFQKRMLQRRSDDTQLPKAAVEPGTSGPGDGPGEGLNEKTSAGTLEQHEVVSPAPSTDLTRSRFPVRREAQVRLGGVPLRKTPHPARLPVGLPPTPRSGRHWKTELTSPVAQPVVTPPVSRLSPE
jgi:hypothetical protein